MDNRDSEHGEIFLIHFKKLNKTVDISENPEQPSCFCGEIFTDREREEIYKSVCNELPAKYEHEGNYYCILHYPKKEKSIEFRKAMESKRDKGDPNFRGIWFPDVADFTSKDWKIFFENIRYKNGEEETSNLRIDFSECVFSNDVYFEDIDFDVLVSFEGTRFLYSADFSYSKFRKVNFSYSIFNSNVSFDSVVFFEDADFWATKFDNQSHIYFRRTEFNKYADFRYAFFIGSVHFEDIKFIEKSGGLDFQYIYHENPEKTSFRGIKLSPSWFVDADAHKIVFEDVEWNELPAYKELEIFKNCIEREQVRIKERIKTFEEEVQQSEDQEKRGNIIEKIERFTKNLERLENRKNNASYQLLGIAYRQIAINTEASGHYEDASRFRTLAFDTEWLDKKRNSQEWWDEFRNIMQENIQCSNLFQNLSNQFKKLFNHLRQYHPHVLYRLYRWSSSYGENWAWALFILIGIIMVSATLYAMPVCSFKVEQSQRENNENLIMLSNASQNLPKDSTEIKVIKVVNPDEDVKFLNLTEAVVYSIRIGTLQSSKLEPGNSIATIIVTLETIVVPLQLALLALAIRRKFMR